MDIGQTIFETARSNGMPRDLANFIVAQARHETEDFTSNVFKTCGNLFGYKFKGQAGAYSCLPSPERDTYAGYQAGVPASVTELTNWIKRRQAEGKFPADLRTITNAPQYAQLLKNAGFYGDTVTNYANRLLKFAVNYGAPIGLPVLLLIAFGIYVARRRKKR